MKLTLSICLILAFSCIIGSVFGQISDTLFVNFKPWNDSSVCKGEGEGVGIGYSFYFNTCIDAGVDGSLYFIVDALRAAWFQYKSSDCTGSHTQQSFKNGSCVTIDFLPSTFPQQSAVMFISEAAIPSVSNSVLFPVFNDSSCANQDLVWYASVSEGYTFEYQGKLNVNYTCNSNNQVEVQQCAIGCTGDNCCKNYDLPQECSQADGGYETVVCGSI